MIKSKEQISMEKKAYYQIVKKYKKRRYDLMKKKRFIPFAKFSTPDILLLPEHAFGFSGDDISKERFHELIATYLNNGTINTESYMEMLAWEREMEEKEI